MPEQIFPQTSSYGDLTFRKQFHPSQTIGQQAAQQIWQKFPGLWETRILPENTRALKFWQKTISEFTKGNFLHEIINVDYDAQQPQRCIFVHRVA